MGKNIYYYVVAAVIILGLVMPQQGPKKKNYIILMAALHTFVCGWRYQYLTGDLRKYAASFLWHMDGKYFSPEIFGGGRNFGFTWLLKFIYDIGGEFQWVLIVIAIISEITLAILIYKYSPRPWLSYLMWNCVGLYIFGFSAIKQALAMGLLMPACDGLLSDKRSKFFLWTLLAGAIHAPALVFLPAYWITHDDKKGSWIVLATAALLIVVFRVHVAEFISQFYYTDDALEELNFSNDGGLGMRFIMMALLLIMGYLIKGLSGTTFRRVFKLIAVAAVLQTFSTFDNVFTRLADYYFQFIVIYTPMMFFDFEKHGSDRKKIRLDRGATLLAMVAVASFSVWFYSNSSLNYTSDNDVDNVTNYRFCWEEEDPFKRGDPEEDIYQDSLFEFHAFGSDEYEI